MRACAALLLAILSAQSLRAETLSWTAPTTLTNGTPITAQDIKEYRVNIYDGAGTGGALILSLRTPGASTSVSTLSLAPSVGAIATFEIVAIDNFGSSSTAATIEYTIP